MRGRNSQNKIVGLTLALAACLSPLPALAVQGQPVTVYAQPDENLRKEHVSYADLDLTTVKGERRLLQRVGGAVKRVCLFDSSHIGLQDNGYYRCSDEAWDGAKPQIAQATARAKEIALNGTSSIAATAITISGS